MKAGRKRSTSNAQRSTLELSPAELQQRSIRFAQREVEVCGFTLLAMKINRADAKTPHQKRVATYALGMAEERAENARLKLARELRGKLA